MSLKIDASLAEKYLSIEELEKAREDAKKALEVLNGEKGEGSDFLGWKDYPINYDKE